MQKNISVQNCGLTHRHKACPAYKDTCISCGSLGYWKKYCRKSRSTSSKVTENKQTKSRYQKKKKPHHEVNLNDPETSTYQKSFNSVVVSAIAICAISKDEAFSTVYVKFDHSSVKLFIILAR